MEGKTYKEFQSEMCPASPPIKDIDTTVWCGETISPGTAAAISVVAVISFMVFVLVIKNLIKKTSNAQGNQPNPNEEMREEGDEAIRRAFEIIDDHERNLARRLENVRR